MYAFVRIFFLIFCTGGDAERECAEKSKNENIHMFVRAAP